MTENTRKQFTDHAIEQSNTHHPYCLICGTSVEKHPVLLMEDVVREEIEENEEIASDDEVDQWYIERAHEFEFYPFLTTCLMCFEREAFYIGVTAHGAPFEFCRQCRDQLQALKIERTQSPERFGA